MTDKYFRISDLEKVTLADMENWVDEDSVLFQIKVKMENGIQNV